jgi:hypothetical protein
MFAKQQADYGSNEGGSGRPTVLDHPLHIALFERIFRQYLPPHLRTLANQPRLLPPLALTLVYPLRLDTVLRRLHGPMHRLHIGGHKGGITQSRLRRVDVKHSPTPSPSYHSDDEHTPSSEFHATSSTGTSNFTDNSASQSPPVEQSPPLPHVESESEEHHNNRNTSLEAPPIPYSDNYLRQPYNPISSRYLDSVVPPFDPDDLMNLAEFSHSSTVQGGNVVNVAVEHHAAAPDRDVPEEYSTNAATIAQTAIVIDEDDASSRGHNVQLY